MPDAEKTYVCLGGDDDCDSSDGCIVVADAVVAAVDAVVAAVVVVDQGKRGTSTSVPQLLFE